MSRAADPEGRESTVGNGSPGGGSRVNHGEHDALGAEVEGFLRPGGGEIREAEDGGSAGDGESAEAGEGVGDAAGAVLHVDDDVVVAGEAGDLCEGGGVAEEKEAVEGLAGGEAGAEAEGGDGGGLASHGCEVFGFDDSRVFGEELVGNEFVPSDDQSSLPASARADRQIWDPSYWPLRCYGIQIQLFPRVIVNSNSKFTPKFKFEFPPNHSLSSSPSTPYLFPTISPSPTLLWSSNYTPLSSLISPSPTTSPAIRLSYQKLSINEEDDEYCNLGPHTKVLACCILLYLSHKEDAATWP